ncbi:MAG: menaquinol oxidoreductase, partial [Desulfobacterales bacterium]|nr:menaquinol oxidoreductase [Desulfobacterales bacterium]
MNRKYFSSLLAVFILFIIAFVGAKAGSGGQFLFGIIIPYLALIIFIVGFVKKVMGWASSPVPFRIPSTCGQQKSLPWIKHSWLDTPWTKTGVAARMFLEIVCFRSLFRNTRMQIQEGSKITYKLELELWLAALAFHYAFLVTLIRHLRLFTEPVPYLVQLLEHIDSFFRFEILHEFVQIGLPGFFISGLVLAAAVAFLLLRRIVLPQIRYISLASDFFPLFLILGIAVSGIFMRYFAKIDVTAAKELTMGLVTFHPHIPPGVDSVFFVHLFFVS